MSESTTVYVSIGNTDGRLSPAQWADLWRETNELLTGSPAVERVYGVWHSLPASLYVNACWAVEVRNTEVERVCRRLGKLAEQYRQESIAWAEVPTTYFIEPTHRPGATT